MLPLSPVLQITDWLVADAFLRWLNSVEPVPPACYCGGVAGTQPCDIISGCSLSLERFPDAGGDGELAQADITVFYDSIDLVLVGR